MQMQSNIKIGCIFSLFGLRFIYFFSASSFMFVYIYSLFKYFYVISWVQCVYNQVQISLKVTELNHIYLFISLWFKISI